MASVTKKTNHKGVKGQQMEKLQQQLEILEKQMAEQALLKQKLEQLTNPESTRNNKTVKLEIMEKQMAEQALLKQKLEELTNPESTRNNKTVDKSSIKVKKPDDVNSETDDKNLKQKSNKVVEDIIAKRTKEFMQSQAEKAATIQYLAQQRQQIMKARHRLKEKHDMFRSLPSPVGAETVITFPNKHSQNVPNSPDVNIHKLVNEIPNAVNRIQALREHLHKDFTVRGKPYAGELGIESYEPWQIPDFLMVRRLVEDFVDDFISKHIPSSFTVLERNLKIKALNQKNKNWVEMSEALTDKSAVKLVAEEILLEVTAKLIQDVSYDGIHVDVMFKRMSENMFMKETEVQATGNPNGRDPSDPAYDLITRCFSSLQRNRDHNKRGVWVHSQTMSHPALPPPVPIVRQSVPLTEKHRRNKSTQKPHMLTENKPGSKIENITKRQQILKNIDF